MPGPSKTIAVSACLLGINCKYNGKNNKNEELLAWLADKKIIPICPEVLGGLPTPRPAAEIVNGIVTNNQGQSVHEEFTRGAAKALAILQKQPVDLVILQSRSPSCGVKEIYDGSFTGVRIAGQGVTAALLQKHGYKLLDIEDFPQFLQAEQKA